MSFLCHLNDILIECNTQETDINELNYQMGMCYYSLQQSDEARELLNKFLNATVNKEYNDKIKYQREQAQRAIRMMMW